MKSHVSSYEDYKKRKERETKRVNNYILKNIQTIRNDSNIENVDPVTEEEVNIILKTIETELAIKENDVIKKAVEFEYNRNKLKMFLNKDKYIERNTEFYKGIFKIVNNYIRKAHRINNNFGIYYCTSQARELSDILLKKHKRQRITSGSIINFMACSYKFYSDITKELYVLTHNKEEVSKIRNYEKIKWDNIIKQIDQQKALIDVLGKNVKTLTYNVNNEIDKGFFGL